MMHNIVHRNHVDLRRRISNRFIASSLATITELRVQVKARKNQGSDEGQAQTDTSASNGSVRKNLQQMPCRTLRI